MSVTHPARLSSSLLFFFNDTATTEIYTLSLHDALPIFRRSRARAGSPPPPSRCSRRPPSSQRRAPRDRTPRSEEHTSELQSQSNIVCRLLLEKKNSRPSTIFKSASMHLFKPYATRAGRS